MARAFTSGPRDLACNEASSVGDPSLRLKSGSARDDATEDRGQKFKLSHYPTVARNDRSYANVISRKASARENGVVSHAIQYLRVMVFRAQP